MSLVLVVKDLNFLSLVSVDEKFTDMAEECKLAQKCVINDGIKLIFWQFDLTMR